MGLGGGPSEWDDYEWFRLADLPPARPAPGAGTTPRGGPDTRPAAGSLAAAVDGWLRSRGAWAGDEPRVLLVDLDNLRAGPLRWRHRMVMVVSLARRADLVALAGQHGAVRRARPYLAEFAGQAHEVADGSDLADYVLLDAADTLPARSGQFVVVSNDGIFATLATRGVLTVLSPGGNALSDRLRTAATHLVDLTTLEPTTPGPPRASAHPTRRPRARSTTRAA